MGQRFQKPIRYGKVVYVDSDGVCYTREELDDYDLKKGERYIEVEEQPSAKWVHTIVKIEIYGRKWKQGSLF